MKPMVFQHTQLLASRSAGVAPWRRLAALVGALPFALHAETAPATPALALPDTGLSVLRVFGALAVVFAVFFGLVWLYRNWQRVLVRNGRMPLLNVLEARTLGNRHALYVVTCGEERFLIGSSPTGLNLLSHLEAPDSASPVLEPRPAPGAPRLVSFADTLQVMLGRK